MLLSNGKYTPVSKGIANLHLRWLRDEYFNIFFAKTQTNDGESGARRDCIAFDYRRGCAVAGRFPA